MQFYVTIAGAVIGLNLIAWGFLALHGKRWRDRWSPVGVWMSDDESTILQFEGELRRGDYKQLVRCGDHSIREFGHWSLHHPTLHMTTMATDPEDHPRLGVDTTYRITHVALGIEIVGPDGSGTTYEPAVEGESLDFDLRAESEA